MERIEDKGTIGNQATNMTVTGFVAAKAGHVCAASGPTGHAEEKPALPDPGDRAPKRRAAVPPGRLGAPEARADRGVASPRRR